MPSHWDSSLEADLPGVHGVEVDVVCGNVPVVALDKSSDFEENAAWMIQSACESSGRADSLYEWSEDEDILSECRRLGMNKDDLGIVRLRESARLRAVGVSGKRSIMVACVIAMSIADPDGLEPLWEGLRNFKLHRKYWDVMEMVNKLLDGGRRGGGGSSADRGGWKDSWNKDSRKKDSWKDSYRDSWKDSSKGTKRYAADDYRRGEGTKRHAADDHGSWTSKSGKYSSDREQNDSSGHAERAKSDPYGGYVEEDSGLRSKERLDDSDGPWGGKHHSTSSSRRGGGGSKKKEWAPSTAAQLDDQLASYFND